MSYTIITSAGSTLTTVFDGTVDTSSTSLVLVGKNYAGYGVFLNENFVKLMENFANANPPQVPLTGQIWYDTGDNKLRAYSGSQWKGIANIESSSSAPIAPDIGDMWWDIVSSQLKMYSGSDWILVGPISAFSSTGLSGPTVDTILDSNQISHVVIKFTVSNVPLAIISKDAEFTPMIPVAGFAVIKPGLTLSNANTLTSLQFVGDATNALALNGLSSSNFLRNDQNITTNYTVRVVNDSGLTVGGSNNFNIGVASGSVKLTSTVNNSDLNLWINKGGVDSKAIGINGTTGEVTIFGGLTASTNVNVAGSMSVSGTTSLQGVTTISNPILPSSNGAISLGSDTAKFATVYANNFVGGTLSSRDLNLVGDLSVGGTTRLTGVTTVSNAIVPSANGTINLGSEATRFATVYANNLVSPSLQIQNLSLPGVLSVTGTTNLQTLQVASTMAVGGTVNLQTLQVASTMAVGGTVELSGAVIPKSSGTLDLGTSSNKFNTLYVNRIISDQGSPDAIGVNQTWQDVTANRAFSVNYTNNTGRPIMLVGVFRRNGPSTANVNLVIGGVQVPLARNTNSSGGNDSTGSLIIPNNTVYRLVNIDEPCTIQYILELR